MNRDYYHEFEPEPPEEDFSICPGCGAYPDQACEEHCEAQGVDAEDFAEYCGGAEAAPRKPVQIAPEFRDDIDVCPACGRKACDCGPGRAA
jgi:hypothetical protein